jgi:hypothetical protein
MRWQWLFTPKNSPSRSRFRLFQQPAKIETVILDSPDIPSQEGGEARGRRGR